MTTLTLEEKSLLVAKLLACPSCNKRSGRKSVVAQLPEALRHAIKFGAQSTGKQDATAIVASCLGYENGWDALIKAVAFFDGGKLVFEELQRYVSGLSSVGGSVAIAKVVLVNVPPRNPSFVGRERELKEIYDTLQKSSTVPITALHGMGGVGKTSLALEYLYRHEAAYNLIAWLPSQTRIGLEEAFLKLARPLGMLALPAKAKAEERTQRVENIKTELAKRGKGCLLVFDNAEEARLVKSFQPGGNSHGHILITTRNQQVGMLEQPVGADVLPEADALTLLASYCAGASVGRETGETELTWRNEQEKKDAVLLVNELGRLALAVKQAGSYIYSCQCSVSEYLTEFKQVRLELFGESFAKPQDCKETVATTWQVSFLALRKQNAGAADWLNLLAFFSPEAIRLDWFTKPASELAAKRLPESVRELTGGGLDKLNAGLAALLQYSLVSRSGNEVQLHSLGQLAARDRLLSEKISLPPDDESETAREVEAYGYWLNIAIGFLLESFPDAEDYRQWAACAEMLSHVKSVLGCYLEQVTQRGSVGTGWPQSGLNLQWLGVLFSRTAIYYKKRGFYDQARHYYETALALSEQVNGPEHQETAITLDNVAALLKAHGDYKTARPLYERALAIREKVFGAEHPDTAQSLNNLAGLLREQVDYEAARLLYERSIAICEKVLGEEHPDTAQSLNNLAALLASQGDYKTARPLYERALAIREKVLGAEHPDTAQSLHNLAALLKAQEDYKTARPLYERALAIREKVLGAEHPDTTLSLLNVAAVLYDIGELEAALPLLRWALAIRRKKLGESHHNTKTVARWVADVEAELAEQR